METPEAGTIAIQLLKSDGIVHVILDAYGPDERAFALDSAMFSILSNRMKAMAEQESGHDLMQFETLDVPVPEIENND